jgi:hypothetical protein
MGPAKIVIAVLFVIAANSTRANTMPGIANSEARSRSVRHCTKHNIRMTWRRTPSAGSKRRCAILRKLTAKTSRRIEQAILVAIVHIAFLGVMAGKEPQEIAADYMKMCVAMNRDHG